MNKGTARLLDANLNRVREGLRVCEDVVRFIWEEPNWFLSFRDLRHRITQIAIERMDLTHLIRERDSENDIGRGVDSLEGQTLSLKELFSRNLQRVKEGLRVLEELSQEIDPTIRQTFQTLRYSVYDLEKKIVSHSHWNENKNPSALRHSG